MTTSQIASKWKTENDGLAKVLGKATLKAEYGV